MFNQDKKKLPVANTVAPKERNVIAKNTTIVGEIKSDGDFRIDGTLEGNLFTKGKVIIGNSGSVNGILKAKFADVEGKISGKLHVDKTLAIRAVAEISGEVIAGKLSIEPGAKFNASCEMRVVKKQQPIVNGEEKPKTEPKKAFK